MASSPYRPTKCTPIGRPGSFQDKGTDIEANVKAVREVAAAAVQGVDALEGYFARYLPQLVLACVVPFAVIGWVATIDIQSALLMTLTLPLVPVFMWLIGRATEQQTRERWRALRHRLP